MKKHYAIIVLVLLLVSWNMLIEPTPTTAEIEYPVMATGEVYGLRHVTLKEGVSTESFEQFFLDEYQPFFDENIPGLKVILTKGDRGEDVGGYVFIWKTSSISTRNYYWPGDGSGSGKWPDVCGDTCAAMLEKFDTYVAENVTTQYTDYAELTR